MAYTVVGKNIDVHALWAKIGKHTTDAMADSARAIVLEQVALIQRRGTPDGGAQKSNASSTVKAKGHSIPLIGPDRRLTNPASYAVEVSGTEVIIHAPISSELLTHLRALGFELFEVSDASIAKTGDLIDKAVGEAISTLPRLP